MNTATLDIRSRGRYGYLTIAIVSRAFTIFLIVVWLIMVAREGFSFALLLWGLLVLTLPGTLAWYMYRLWVAKITATGSGVTVTGLRGTTEYRWSEIRAFDVGGGYFGIDMELTSGQRVLLPAVQKSNLATWLGRRTHADKVVDALNQAVRNYRTLPDAESMS